jgi:hypothetical protein
VLACFRRRATQTTVATCERPFSAQKINSARPRPTDASPSKLLGRHSPKNRVRAAAAGREFRLPLNKFHTTSSFERLNRLAHMSAPHSKLHHHHSILGGGRVCKTRTALLMISPFAPLAPRFPLRLSQTLQINLPPCRSDTRPTVCSPPPRATKNNNNNDNHPGPLALLICLPRTVLIHS